jgi:hypothetical protein
VIIIETKGADEAERAGEGTAGKEGAGDEVIILLVLLPSSFFRLTRYIFNR